MIGNQPAEDLRRCCDALESENETLRAELIRVSAERDALISDNAGYVGAASELATENLRLREALERITKVGGGAWGAQARRIASAALDAECADLAHQLNQSNERNGVLRASLKECSAELFAQCGDQKRAMQYVERARAALAQEQE